MSVFSNPQGRPGRVRALLRLLAAFPAGLTVSQIESWLTPGELKHSRGDPAEEASDESTKKNMGVPNTRGVAISLGLIEEHEKRYRLTPGVSERLADADLDFLIHERFVGSGDPGDRLLVALYAYFVVRSSKEGGTSWTDLSNKALKDAADSAFAKAGDGYEGITFNTSRIAAWKDWASFLGLGLDGVSGGKSEFVPDVTTRFLRELVPLSQEFGFDKPVPADRFVASLAKRCPYLDGGTEFLSLAKAIGAPIERTLLSPVTASALREAEFEKRLVIVDATDSSGAIRLSGDDVESRRSIATISILSATGAPL